MTTVDDETLAREGDAAAFERLLRRYDDQMRGVAYRLLGRRAAMDDALQDAYVKAFRNLGRFRGDSAFSTWLYRIVTTTCLDHLRRSARRTEDELPDEPTPLGGLRADGVGDAASRRADLRRALDQLRPTHRAVLVLVDGEGLSYDEAGDLLDLAPGTVASRLSRARSRMRELLDSGEAS